MSKIKCDTWDGSWRRYAHFKRDGQFIRIATDSKGKLHFWSSRPRQLVLDWVMLEQCLPSRTVIAGELYVPGHPASEVKRAIKNRSKHLRFEAFAVEAVEGQDFPIAASLEDIDELCTVDWNVPFVNYFIMCVGATGIDEKMFFEHAQTCDQDIEGFVFKDGNLLNWAKWKPVKTIDLIIVDFNEGNGKHLGLIGSLECAVYDTNGELQTVASVGGMTDDCRLEISLSMGRCLGKVVEVAYQYVGSQGRLRHPRFIGFRDDKEAHECLISQDPDLEK